MVGGRGFGSSGRRFPSLSARAGELSNCPFHKIDNHTMTSAGGDSNTTGSAIVALASASLGAIAATFACYAMQRDTTGSNNIKADDTKANDEVGGKHNNLSAASPCSASPSDAVALIRHRRSIFPKQYTGDALSRDVINNMLEAARFAPSHKLTEAWRFVIFESEEIGRASCRER